MIITAYWRTSCAPALERLQINSLVPSIASCDVLDPITGIGLGCQLAGQAFSLLEHLIKFCKELSDAPSECKALSHELCDLSSTLFHVEESYSNQDMPERLKSELDALKGPLEEMRSITNHRQTEGIRRLQWPFRKNESNKYLGIIKRSMERIDIFLNSDNRYVVHMTNVDWTRRTLGRIETSTRNIELKAEETHVFNQGSFFVSMMHIDR